MTVRKLASDLWRRVLRRALGKLLHPARRRAALRRLRARRHNLKSVLFVCHGNICRSPYAEGAFRQSLAGKVVGVQVGSAGFLESGRPAPHVAVVAAARRGVNLESHRSRRVDTARVREADLIVVMDPYQEQKIRSAFGRSRADVLILADLQPAFGEARMIPDPVDRPLETFERVYAQIDECLAALRSALSLGDAG